MKVIKRKPRVAVQFGGEEHRGWLPPDASMPLATPIEVVKCDIEIVSENGGYLLCWHSRDNSKAGDTWYNTLESAEEAAEQRFGIKPCDWEIVAR